MTRDETPEAPNASPSRKGIIRRAGGLVKGAAKLYGMATFGDINRTIEDRRIVRSWLKDLARRRHRDGRTETFSGAMSRLGVTEDQLAARAGQLRRMGRIYLAAAAAAFLLLVLAPASAMPAMQFVTSLGVMVMAGSKAAASYFRYSQIQARRLFGFVEWATGNLSDGDGDDVPIRSDGDPQHAGTGREGEGA